jgi:hypothetical protein
MDDFEWMQDARCRGVIDPMWDSSVPVTEALRFCFRCPVRAECAAYGLSRPYASDAGVLGGLGMYDRQRIRARKTTLSGMWRFRLNQLVLSDWETALDEQFVRQMPRAA